MCLVLAAMVENLNRSLGMNTSLTLSNFIQHKKMGELINSSRLKLALDSVHVKCDV